LSFVGGQRKFDFGDFSFPIINSTNFAKISNNFAKIYIYKILEKKRKKKPFVSYTLGALLK